MLNRVLVVMEIRTKAFVPETDLAGCPEIMDMLLVDAFKEGGVAWVSVRKLPQAMVDHAASAAQH